MSFISHYVSIVFMSTFDQVIPAAVMVCKETATLPRIEPSKRNVAVPLSPSTSSVDQRSEGARSINSCHASKFPSINMQTTLSVIELGIPSGYLPRHSFSEDDINLHHVISHVEENSNNDHVEKLSFKLNRVSKTKLQKINTIMWCRSFNAINQLLKKLSHELKNDAIIQKYFYPLESKIFRFDNPSTSSSLLKSQDNYAKIDVIKTWLDGINLKSHDFLNRPVKRDQILTMFTNKLKNVNFNERRKNVRAKIVDILDDLPINFYGTTRKTYLNRLANMLLNGLYKINFGAGSSNINRYKYVNFSQSGMMIFTSGIQPTENELKVIVREELMDYVEKNKLAYNLDRINDVEADIIEILLDLMGDIKADRDGNAKEEIISVLRETSMFAAQPEELAKRILEQLKEMFNVVDESHITEKPQSKTESIIVYQNRFRTYKASTLDSESQTSYEDNLKLYTLKISHVIDDWLNDFGCHKIKFYDKHSRQAIIDDLAEDLVDRFKYLELNPPKHYLFDDIEYLKYQVFKLLNKLTGENNWASLETAPDLMRRIIKIPLPVLNSIDAHNFKYATENYEKETGTDNLLRLISDRSCSTESFEQICRQCSSTHEALCTEIPIIMNTPRRMSQLSMFESSKLSSQLSNVTTTQPAVNETVNCENPATISSVYVSLKEQDNLQVPNALSSDPTSSNFLTPSKSVKELNNEYDDFVKNWIHEIPIPSSTPEEQNLAEKLRIGIYNAVWKTVAKLKNHPSSIYNPFHYQDLLDDELEDIFQSLPQTEELQAKKHYLKVQFIEKTVNTNEQIKSSFAPDILKQNLVHNVLTHIPKTRTNIADENPVKLHEELEILQLAELYILYARFKDEDQLKANVFRTKLVKRLQEIVDELKRIHQKELEHIDRDLYMNELLYAMQQVPLPSEETIKAEADEILLGMEIEQWMGYLPMVTIENTRELFTRRRLKDKLAKKVHDLEKSVNVSNVEGSRLLKMEISAFLDKLPLQKDQSLNLNFMVDELTNRIKNMNNYGTGNLNASGLDNLDFADFSRQIKKASSYNQMPVPNGHQSINALTGGHVSIPYTQPCNGNNNGSMYGVQQAIPPGINAQLSTGQVPNGPCSANCSNRTISLWQSFDDASAAGQLQGMQPPGNISTAGGNRSQSFGPPSNPLLRPQQATSLGPVQYIQPGPLQQQPPSTITDTSVYFGPRSAAPIQSPQRYTSFEQQNPASSSFHIGQEINQSNVQPRGFHECGSPPVAGRPNVLAQPTNVNQSYHETVNSADYHTLPTDSQQVGNPCSVRQAGVPSIAEQSRQATEPPNQLVPQFYRSTDPQGIKRFTEQNMRNRSQSENQHISRQNVLSEFPASQGSISQGRPANTGQVSPCPVTCSAQNDINVQAPPPKLTPPCPGKQCPALKRAMETQCPAKGCFFHYDDWDQEELNIRCRCLERFKKNRIRRFGSDSVYRFSPCFCFPDMV